MAGSDVSHAGWVGVFSGTTVGAGPRRCTHASLCSVICVGEVAAHETLQILPRNAQTWVRAHARLPNKQGREMQLVLARTHLGLVRLVHVHTKLLSNLIYKRRFVSLLRFAVRQCAVDESPARRV